MNQSSISKMIASWKLELISTFRTQHQIVYDFLRFVNVDIYKLIITASHFYKLILGIISLCDLFLSKIS